MTTVGDLRIRMTKAQKELLKNLAEMNGYPTMTAFAKSKIFDDLTIHKKLNQILEKIHGGNTQDESRRTQQISEQTC